MVEALLAFAFGALVGGVFALARQPIPAPPSIPGALGVIGVTLGFLIAKHVRG